MNKNKLKNLALCSVMLCVALILSYVEALLPLPIALPGVKLGLANCAVLFLLLTYPAYYALSVSLLRVFLTFLLFGNPTALMLSFAGAITSFLVMYILSKTRLFSPVGISVGGAAIHITAQILVSYILTGTAGTFYYLPYLLLISVVTGVINGFLVILLLKRVKIKINAKQK